MKDYSNYYPSRGERLRHKAERNFEVHFNNGDESYEVMINNAFKKQVIIKRHSNPMNENLEDMKMYYVDSSDPRKKIKWGDVISGYDDGDGHNYLVVSRPESNGVTSKARIRKMYDKIRFTLNGKQYFYDCIIAKGLLYTATSYTTPDEVFSDEDMIAIAIRYDEVTAKLKMFDEVWVNKNELYKVAKVDNYTMKEQSECYGVLQIVLIKTVFGKLQDERLERETYEVDGILRYAQLKERVYNAKARELLTHHDKVNSGDYVVHTFPRNPYEDNCIIDDDDYTETRRYLVYSLVDMRSEYDSTFILNCPYSFNIKDDDGDAYTVWAYFDSNATQLMTNERNSNVYNENSKLMCYVQDNRYTHKLGKEILRIMMNREDYDDPNLLDCYEIVGTDSYTYKGCIRVELRESKINPITDNLKLRIADYYKDNYIEDRTSDESFETIYNDVNSWIYLSGYKQILLGETVTFNLECEPKILAQNIVPISTNFRLTMEDGSELLDGLFYTVQGNDIIFSCSSNKKLLGKKIEVYATCVFEEKVLNELTGSVDTIYHTSELQKEYFVSGW